MTSEDERQFLTFLRTTADVQIFGSFAQTTAELWLSEFTHSESFFRIWNKQFDFVPVYATVTRGKHDRLGLQYISNFSTAPVIEYSRYDINQPNGGISRIFWAKYFCAPDGLNYDVELFERWYKKIARWLKSNGIRMPGRTTHGTYYLPNAWESFGKHRA